MRMPVSSTKWSADIQLSRRSGEGQDRPEKDQRNKETLNFSTILNYWVLAVLRAPSF
jgi:hypothetical protein